MQFSLLYNSSPCYITERDIHVFLGKTAISLKNRVENGKGDDNFYTAK